MRRKHGTLRSKKITPLAVGTGLSGEAGLTCTWFGENMFILTRGDVQPVHLVGAVVRVATALKCLSCPPSTGQLAWSLSQTLAFPVVHK